MLTSLGIAMSFNNSAAQELLPPEPTPAITVVQEDPPPPPVKKLTEDELRSIAYRNLSIVYSRMNATNIGRELMQFADKETLDVSFRNPRSAFHKDGTIVEYDEIMLIAGVSYGSFITFDPRRGQVEDELLLTLVHELRHAWQDKTAKVFEGLTLSAKQEWLLDRFREADSFAYQIHFAYEYKKETGIEVAVTGTRACHVFMSQSCLMEIYAEKRDSGMSAEEAYPFLLEAAFKHAKQLDYDGDFLHFKKKRWEEVIADPDKGALYEKNVNNPTSDAELVKALRRMVSTTLTPDASSGMSTWTDEDILSFEKTGGLDTRLTDKFNEVEQLQKQAMQAFKQKQKREPQYDGPKSGL